MAYTIQSLNINGALSSPSINFGSNAITFPAVTDEVVTLAQTQTLTNKSLTLPTITSLKDGSGNTVNIPSGADTLVNLTGSQILSNKTLSAPVLKDVFNNTINIPSGADTLVNLTSVQTLSNKTLVTPVITSIKDASNNTINIPSGTDTLVNLTSAQTLSNKNLVTPVITSIKDASDNIVVIPSGADTLVNLTSAQTLLNKSLVTPVITSIKDASNNIVVIPSGADTLVNLTGTQTLLNKSLISPIVNGVTITGTPTSGQVLQATSGSAASWGSIVVPYTATVSTTDGTATTIATITGADNTSYMVTVNVVGNRTSGGTEAFGEVLRFMYKRNTGAGTIAQIGVDNSIIFYGGILGPTATWGVTSSADTTNGNILIKVTGQSGKSVSWKALIEILSL